MFGYVVVNKPELKIREFEEYRGYYCGMCKSLKTQYGNISRLSLNYDLTFVAMVLSSLDLNDPTISEARCLLHPLNKHKEIHDEYVDYATDMSIVLTYYKCEDDWKDEHKYSSKTFQLLLNKAYRKVENKYEDKVNKIRDCLSSINELEKQNSQDMDKVSGLFGEVMAEIMDYKNDEFKDYLRNFGYYLGKFIYLMDAYEDIEKDIKEKSYNLLINKKENENFEEWIKLVLSTLMAKACDYFEELPIVENVEIIRNILYSGIWSRYILVNKERNK